MYLLRAYKFNMTRFHLFGTLCFFFATIGEILSLNYVSEPAPKFTFFSRAAVLPEPNETISEPRSLIPIRTGIPYTILFPLTIENRGGKSLNLTLRPPAQENQVQSRIMNQPKLYPNFGFDPPIYTRTIESPELPPPSSDEYDDSDNPPVVPPSPPKQYNVKTLAQPPALPAYDKRYIPPTQYNLKSPQLAPVPPPQPQTFDKNVAFIAYLPQQRYNKTKSQPVPRTTKKSPPVPPPFAYNKNTVPKFKILPLQAYNKATFVSSPPTKLQQQFASCICVPYDLCKEGVINSGGRLRTARALKYEFLNKTLPLVAVQPKSISAFTHRQSAEPNQCQPNEICCQLNFADHGDDGNYYPVATPPPEPPRSSGKQSDVCGVRRVNGVQRNLQQPRYTADVAEFGKYPWQVAILKKVVGDKNLYLCGGVLIAPQWIATVAHCIKKDKSSPLLVRLGEWDVNRKDEAYPYVEKDVTTIVIHPDFDSESLENDLALIRIISPVDPRIPHITPACLPFPGQVFDNQKCWVSGWGKNFFGPNGTYQNVLKEVDVPVVSRALCSTELRSTNLGPDFKLHPGFLCAGGDLGKDACTGDGGSPLVCTSNGLWYVVGLVSWGIGCGQPGIPGVYVNVLYYSNWINNVTRRQRQ